MNSIEESNLSSMVSSFFAFFMIISFVIFIVIIVATVLIIANVFKNTKSKCDLNGDGKVNKDDIIYGINKSRNNEEIIKPKEVICPYCDSKIEKNLDLCPNCGAKIKDN